MTQTLTTTTPASAQMLEQVLIGGDLGKLSAADRVRYYNAVCESLNLNALTKPFEYIELNRKLVLYAGRNCTDQLRANHNITLTIVAREKMDDVYVVTARATKPDGRHDESIGAVPIGGLKGEALANAFMKAETKAKRRVTLSICGLSWADETEVPSIPSAKPVTVDMETGEISEASTPNEAVLMISAEHMRELNKHRERLGWDGDTLTRWVKSRADGRGPRELSAEEAATAINALGIIPSPAPAQSALGVFTEA